MRERGQTLILFAALLILFLALTALTLDGGLYFAHWQGLQVDLDAACVAAAIAESKGADGYTAFVGSLSRNGVPAEYYDPYEVGADSLVIRGIQWHHSGRSFLTGLQGPHSFYLAQFMAITSMDIAVRSRCTIPRLTVLPIAVQEPWVLTGIGNPLLTFPILGQGAEPVLEVGNDFRGGVIPQVWCANTNCDPKTFFEPAPEVNASGPLKDVLRDTILGLTEGPLVPIGGIIPHPSGTSNHFLVQAVVDAGYEVGDQIIVMVYNGTITRPDPSYGSWENLQIIYYAVAEITEIDANTITAYFVRTINNLEEVEDEITSRTIPWDWRGTP